MTRRKLAIAIAAGAAGFSAAVLPASAELRTLTVTLLGGAQITVTVDVPPGTPLDQITIPNVSTPIIGVTEIPPVATPGVPSLEPPSQQPPSQQEPEPEPQPSGGEEPRTDPAREGGRQKTTKQGGNR